MEEPKLQRMPSAEEIFLEVKKKEAEARKALLERLERIRADRKTSQKRSAEETKRIQELLRTRPKSTRKPKAVPAVG